MFATDDDASSKTAPLWMVVAAGHRFNCARSGGCWMEFNINHLKNYSNKLTDGGGGVAYQQACSLSEFIS